MHLKQIRALIAQHSNDALAAEEGGHVYQIWEDGEITLQKSGSLLWQRNLHCIERGFAEENVLPLSAFPHRHRESHAFAYVSKEGAYEIRAALLEWLGY